jgi:hypothetical protein
VPQAEEGKYIAFKKNTKRISLKNTLNPAPEQLLETKD